jgi:hypothetical protein
MLIDNGYILKEKSYDFNRWIYFFYFSDIQISKVGVKVEVEVKVEEKKMT